MSLCLCVFHQSSLNLTGFSDADWVGCSITCRITNGHCIFLGAKCISWSFKKQPIVARSSTEVEYRAMATTKITWISFFLFDIGVVLVWPSQCLCDNIFNLHLTINLALLGLKKHIEIYYHFVDEKVAIGQLITQFILSNLQIANIYTKPLLVIFFGYLETSLTSISMKTDKYSSQQKIKTLPKLPSWSKALTTIQLSSNLPMDNFL